MFPPATGGQKAAERSLVVDFHLARSRQVESQKTHHHDDCFVIYSLHIPLTIIPIYDII